jgi:hypothetical protein
MHCPFIASYTVMPCGKTVSGTFHRTCSQHLGMYVALMVAVKGAAWVEHETSSSTPDACDSNDAP